MIVLEPKERNMALRSDREWLAKELSSIAETNKGAISLMRNSFNIVCHFACNGVGARIDIGSYFQPNIHWYNTHGPVRDFTGRFLVTVQAAKSTRTKFSDHKATSHLADWPSLAMALQDGLSLAARGGAFKVEPAA